MEDPHLAAFTKNNKKQQITIKPNKENQITAQHKQTEVWGSRICRFEQRIIVLDEKTCTDALDALGAPGTLKMLENQHGMLK